VIPALISRRIAQGTDGIVYNSDVVKTAPTAYADLWKPEYASNNMVMLDAADDIIGATLLSLGYDVNSKDPKQLDAAKAKLDDLQEQARKAGAPSSVRE